jgi:hypothetical protein
VRRASAVRLRSSTIVGVLGGIVALLTTLYAAVLVARFGFGRDHLMGLAAVFDLSLEANVPTWYSAAALLICALALGLIASVKHGERGPFAKHWTGLALMFAYLSLDEVARFHEHWGVIVETPLGWMRSPAVFGGLFRNLWVIPAALVVLGVGLVYTPFLMHLPGRTRTRFLVAGLLYVFGAGGLEMVASRYTLLGMRESGGFWLIVMTEEVLEMVSVLLFLSGVLRYITQTIGAIELRLDGAEPVT